MKNNYPYGGSIAQTLPYLGVLHGTDVPADPAGLIKLLAKPDCNACLPGSCHVSLLLSVKAAEQTGLAVDLQDASSGELPRAGDSRLLAWQAALEPGLCSFSWAVKNPEQSSVLKQYPDVTFPVLSFSSAQRQQYDVMMTYTASEINREWATIERQCYVVVVGSSLPHAWLPSSVSLVWHDGLAQSMCLLSTT